MEGSGGGDWGFYTEEGEDMYESLKKKSSIFFFLGLLVHFLF